MQKVVQCTACAHRQLQSNGQALGTGFRGSFQAEVHVAALTVWALDAFDLNFQPVKALTHPEAIPPPHTHLEPTACWLVLASACCVDHLQAACLPLVCLPVASIIPLVAELTNLAAKLYGALLTACSLRQAQGCQQVPQDALVTHT